MMRLALNLLMCFAAALAISCASTREIAQFDPMSEAPLDFTLDVLVLAGSEVPRSGKVHQTSSRYVVFPDGSLHFAQTVESRHGLPPIVRILSREQVGDLWMLLRRLGMADKSQADETVNYKLLDARPNEIVHAVGLSGEDEHWNFIRRSSTDQPLDDATTTVVRHLAALAWASDDPERPIKVIPKRYDFGPDPYARYRQGAPEEQE